MLAVASLVAAAACADDVTNAGDPSQVNDVENPQVADEAPDGSVAPEGLVLNTRRAECASDGPCSPACATNAMVIDLHVPTGQCITFDCTAEAGGPDVGGCHP
ncbi:MAG: hypothetical protein JNL83_24040 [Myxococcales bacterium]|nr:hypothetical protein [Myxococcales bacterium]